jgi:hypothetical protein
MRARILDRIKKCELEVLKRSPCSGCGVRTYHDAEERAKFLAVADERRIHRACGLLLVPAPIGDGSHEAWEEWIRDDKARRPTHPNAFMDYPAAAECEGGETG